MHLSPAYVAYPCIRTGAVFPTFPYRGRIETEGLAAMAKDMGYDSYGMPMLEAIHTSVA
jgi:hypothetical protein